MSATLVVAAAAPACAGGLTLDVLDSLTAMQALSPQWQELVDEYLGRNLFLTPAWNRAWWRAFGEDRSLRLLALRDGARLVGVAVYMLHVVRLRGLPVRVLSTPSNAHVSRNDVVVASGFEAAVAQRLAEYFADAARDWDVAWLQQLPADAAWLQPFMAACVEFGLRAFSPTPGVGKCVLPLAGGWAAYRAGKSSHFRKRLKENRQRVERAGAIRFRRSTGSAEDFAEFERLEARSWKHEDGDVRLGAAGWAFQREVALADDGGIRCHNLFLEIDGKVVGALHAVGYSGVAYSMQMLFDESVRDFYPGRAQYAVHLEDMFNDGGYSTLDLNGNSEFCRSWTHTEQPFVSLQLHNRQPYSQLLWLVNRARGRE